MSLPSRARTAARRVLPLLAGCAAVAGAAAGPAHAAAGERIAYAEAGRLFAVAPSGGAAAQLTPQPEHYDAQPAYSPDGRRIAFVLNRDLWVADADGTDRRALTDDGAFASGPSWSPDGERIVFSAAGAGNTGDLFVLPAGAKAGTPPERLTSTAGADERDAAWSPDGKRIAYTRGGCEDGDGMVCVYVMGADGSAPVNLTPETSMPGCESQPGYFFKGGSADPAWSPDGTRIAFEGPLRCEISFVGSDIWVMDASGGGKTDLTADDRTNDSEPVFSPDGSRIAFTRAASAGGTARVFVMAAGGGGARQVTNGPDGLAHTDPTWSVAPRCVVPALRGRTRSQARKALEAAGCRLGAVKKKPAAKARKGRVVAQSKPAGRSLADGAKVGVTLAR